MLVLCSLSFVNIVVFLIPKDPISLRSGLINDYHTIPQVGVHLRESEASSRSIRSSC